MHRIAIVEASGGPARVLVEELGKHAIHCSLYDTAGDYHRAFHHGSHDAVVIGCALPDARPRQLLGHLRERARTWLPAMLLGQHDDEAAEIEALHAGADAVVTLPASPQLMAARLLAVLRRAGGDEDTVQVGAYCIDRRRRVIAHQGRPVALTDKEFQLAELLLRNIGRCLTREYLLCTVWHADGDAATRTVDTHASRVRHKLGLSRHADLWLRPVYGRGYTLVRRASVAQLECA